MRLIIAGIFLFWSLSAEADLCRPVEGIVRAVSDIEIVVAQKNEQRIRIQVGKTAGDQLEYLKKNIRKPVSLCVSLAALYPEDFNRK